MLYLLAPPFFKLSANFSKPRKLLFPYHCALHLQKRIKQVLVFIYGNHLMGSTRGWLPLKVRVLTVPSKEVVSWW